LLGPLVSMGAGRITDLLSPSIHRCGFNNVISMHPHLQHTESYAK